jgi:GrpB-like predicted nucleotidyltransferase (UPF0157 family)
MVPQSGDSLGDRAANRGNLDSMIDEPVSIVPHDLQWPLLARAEIQRLGEAMGPLVEAYEHFGSTSVPGCEAKPIIDLLLGVSEWPPAEDFRRRLTLLGYEDLGEAGVPGRLYFRMRRDRAFNLAVTKYQAGLWRDNLAVRDLLRKDIHLRERYVAEKRAALQAGHTTLLAYSDYKNAFMASLVARARMG